MKNAECIPKCDEIDEIPNSQKASPFGVPESGQLDKRCRKRGNREVGEKQTSESERNLAWTLGERERERAGEQAVINHDHNENVSPKPNEL